MTSQLAAHPFEIVRRRLRGDAVPIPDELPPPIARLLGALDDPSASSRDLAVLFRHALRHEQGALRVPAAGRMPTRDDWRAVGVGARTTGDGFSVTARPWTPSWLPDVPPSGVDGNVAREVQRRASRVVRGDPYLSAVGYAEYQSAGQQAALRAVLGAPRGSTLVVSLPTGEGKSLAFHAIARVGFGEGPGVTLVVTPTVALALDHERSAQARGFDNLPMAFRAAEPERNAPLLERIASGQQSLCFASPEAVTRTLRVPLQDAARRGLLRAIVVDEAHLIDSWGIDFRPDFQMLAGLRRRLLGLAGDRAFRTVLLSATLTDDSIAILRPLFTGTPFGVISAARLRPEIEYWVAQPTGDTEREQRVIEAIGHLPRPAIVYTTTRNDAAHWTRTLREHGHRRLGTVTGATHDSERRRVIDGWDAGSIDLVVGTSAFGLGIDNQHVRAVVHACVPESLDRFYQEVGRGGRDGHASLSLVIPASHDRGIAERLSKRLLLTGDVGQHRWSAMFTHEDHRVEGEEHVVAVNHRPGVGEGEIDMVGPLNTLWNVRTLVLMAAAEGIDLLDVPSQLVKQAVASGDLTDDAESDDVDPGGSHMVRLAIKDTGHMAAGFWEGPIADFRQRQKSVAANSHHRMLEFLEAPVCAAELIAPLYDVATESRPEETPFTVGKACGGCPSCRAHRRAVFEQAAPVTPHPWSAAPAGEPIARLMPSTGHLIVFFETRATGLLDRDRERAALRRIVASGVRNLIVFPDAPFAPDDFAAMTARHSSRPGWALSRCRPARP